MLVGVITGALILTCCSPGGGAAAKKFGATTLETFTSVVKGFIAFCVRGVR